MNAKELLIEALKDMGADGLYNDTGIGCEEACGCGFDDLMPFECDIEQCEPAKRIGDLFYPMERA